MTTNTFRSQRLVSNKLRAVWFRDRLMTLGATYFFVSAVQRETRISVVIENQRGPTRRSVTPTAFRVVVFRELPAVLVVMTISTCQTERLQPEFLSHRVCRHHGVALSTSDRTMLPLQFESAQVMIEYDRMPGTGVVAILTASLSCPAVGLPLVDVAMASRAAGVREIESGVSSPIIPRDRQVTQVARHRQVAARQLITARLMLRDAIDSRQESANRMAGRTFAAVGSGCELPSMCVLMTSVATVVAQGR